MLTVQMLKHMLSTILLHYGTDVVDETLPDTRDRITESRLLSPLNVLVKLQHEPLGFSLKSVSRRHGGLAMPHHRVPKAPSRYCPCVLPRAAASALHVVVS